MKIKKYLTYIFYLILIVFTGCQKEIIGTNPIGPFTVNATLESNGKYVNVSWEKDNYSYRIIGIDTVSQNELNSDGKRYSYTLKNIPFNTEFEGKVEACDSKGNCTESKFKIKTSSDVKITDKNFENFLSRSGINIIDGKLSENEASKVNSLILIGEEILKVEDLSGIELFPNLETLLLTNGFSENVKFLDLSKNTKLKTLVINDTKIKAINLNKNILLETLGISAENLKSLDISNNKKLKTLSFTGSPLKNINLTENTLLTDLAIDLSIEELDLSKNVDLINLGSLSLLRIDNKNYNFQGAPSQSTNLSTLDLTNNTKIETIFLNSPLVNVANKISNINISKCIELKELSLGKCSLNKIDITKNLKLKVLNFEGTNLSNINLDNNANLESLVIRSNQFIFIDLSKKNKLTFLNISGNKLTDIKLPENIQFLDVSKNNLRSLDITKSPRMTSLYCSDNNLETLDLTKITSLESFYLVSWNNLNLKTICVSNVQNAKNISTSKNWVFDKFSEIKICN